MSSPRRLADWRARSREPPAPTQVITQRLRSRPLEQHDGCAKRHPTPQDETIATASQPSPPSRLSSSIAFFRFARSKVMYSQRCMSIVSCIRCCVASPGRPRCLAFECPGQRALHQQKRPPSYRHANPAVRDEGPARRETSHLERLLTCPLDPPERATALYDAALVWSRPRVRILVRPTMTRRPPRGDPGELMRR